MNKSRRFRSRGRIRNYRFGKSTQIRALFNPEDFADGALAADGPGFMSESRAAGIFHKEEGRLPHRPARFASAQRGR